MKSAEGWGPVRTLNALLFRHFELFRTNLVAVNPDPRP